VTFFGPTGLRIPTDDWFLSHHSLFVKVEIFSRSQLTLELQRQHRMASSRAWLLCASVFFMRDDTAHAVFKKYAGVMAYISVEQDGRHSIGSAFHIGEGVFVTARHVTDGKNIKQVAMTHEGYVELTGDEATKTTEFLHGKPVRWIKNGVLEIVKGPYYHRDPTVDVAVFEVEGLDPGTPFVQLGGHFDEFLELDDFILEKVIVFGYPPIPFTKTPYLMAVTAEINAQIHPARRPPCSLYSLIHG
jgi:hypothetical protein